MNLDQFKEERKRENNRKKKEGGMERTRQVNWRKAGKKEAQGVLEDRKEKGRHGEWRK